jgi:hypothetical protein
MTSTTRQTPDLALINGPVITLDGGGSGTPTGIAVRGRFIAAVDDR